MTKLTIRIYLSFKIKISKVTHLNMDVKKLISHIKAEFTIKIEKMFVGRVEPEKNACGKEAADRFGKNRKLTSNLLEK